MLASMGPVSRSWRSLFVILTVQVSERVTLFIVVLTP